jgi:RimJ/RimL family protein N-acetyltransferase
MGINSEIKSERLVIRRFKPEDWRDIHEYLSDKDVVRFEPYETFCEEESREEAICRSESEAFLAVCLKDSGKVIGNLYFEKQKYDTYEIGYVFNKNYWHKGYATESARALIDHAFKELKARRIIAKCDQKNDASWKLLERLHMRREASMLQNVYFKTDVNNEPVWKDTYAYGILAFEWQSNF